MRASISFMIVLVGGMVAVRAAGAQQVDPCFQVSPERAQVGQNIVFDAACSSVVSDDATYIWYFDCDEALLYGRRVERTFSSPGSYFVQLEVRSGGSSSSTTTSSTVTVASVRSSPIATTPIATTPSATTPSAAACFEWSKSSPQNDRLVTFDASCSEVPAENVGYGWYFEHDGTRLHGAIVQREFATSGEYVVRLDIQTANGAQSIDSVTQTVTIEPKAPVPCFELSPEKPRVGEPVKFDASCTTAPPGSVVYRWHVSREGPDTEPGVRGDRSFQRSFTEPGRYVVRLSVRSIDTGGRHEITRTVTIRPALAVAPVAVDPPRGDGVRPWHLAVAAVALALLAALVRRATRRSAPVPVPPVPVTVRPEADDGRQHVTASGALVAGTVRLEARRRLTQLRIDVDGPGIASVRRRRS